MPQISLGAVSYSWGHPLVDQRDLDVQLFHLVEVIRANLLPGEAPLLPPLNLGRSPGQSNGLREGDFANAL